MTNETAEPIETRKQRAKFRKDEVTRHPFWRQAPNDIFLSSYRPFSDELIEGLIPQ